MSDAPHTPAGDSPHTPIDHSGYQSAPGEAGNPHANSYAQQPIDPYPAEYAGYQQPAGYGAGGYYGQPTPGHYYAAPDSAYRSYGATATYAGFWLRVLASLIDAFILMFVNNIISIPFSVYLQNSLANVNPNTGPPPAFFGLLIGVYGAIFLIDTLYFAVMESSRHQGTVGKIVLGLKVTDMNGSRLSFAHAIGRNLAKFLSYLTLYIGFMMAGWTERKQALHDMVSNCLVIKPGKGDHRFAQAQMAYGQYPGYGQPPGYGYPPYPAGYGQSPGTGNPYGHGQQPPTGYQTPGTPGVNDPFYRDPNEPTGR